MDANGDGGGCPLQAAIRQRFEVSASLFPTNPLTELHTHSCIDPSINYGKHPETGKRESSMRFTSPCAHLPTRSLLRNPAVEHDAEDHDRWFFRKAHGGRQPAPGPGPLRNQAHGEYID